MTTGELVRDILEGEVEELGEEELRCVVHLLLKTEILPGALYSPGETAVLLGFRARTQKGRQNAIARIPPYQLPRTPTGSGGGNVMFLGRDILAYVEMKRQGRRM